MGEPGASGRESLLNAPTPECAAATASDARSTTELESEGGVVAIEPWPGDRWRISVRPNPGVRVARNRWVSRYPLDLIRAIHATKGLYVCDEIMREEDPRYVEHYLRHEVLTYVPAGAFRGKRILDFGCGSGASSVVLARLLPECQIIGVELEERLLRIARLRAEHFGLHRARFLRSPSGDALPEGLGSFDFVLFSAVFEHLLPSERRMLLPLVWRRLNPGGILFLNQTPHRYAPIETHTTSGMPLINYLPDAVTFRIVRCCSRRHSRQVTWERLLRAGIRGATVAEIVGILRRHEGRAVVLEPRSEVGDRIDLWYGSLSARQRWLKRGIWGTLKLIKLTSGIVITPSLALALRRE
jgi:2-polyprenyl-3-methyl-5-hydroxy-6-metoxy-1,4-benzoquinol methylase